MCLNTQVLLSEELLQLLPQNVSLPGSGRGHQKSIITIQAYLVLGDQLAYEGLREQ